MAGLRWGRDALNVHPLHLHLLLVFHPPILEPDLDLPLCQAQHGRHLNPPEQRTGQLPFFGCMFYSMLSALLRILVNMSALTLLVSVYQIDSL